METFKNEEVYKQYFQSAYGYAVFESIAKAGMMIFGGAMGKGTVYIKNKMVGSSKMMQASLGPQLGGQIYSMIIFFESEKDYKHFIEDNFEFGLDAKAVVLTASAGAAASTYDNNVGVQAGIHGMPDAGRLEQRMNSVQYTKGFAIFTLTLGGLMYEATLSGQKYNFNPIKE